MLLNIVEADYISDYKVSLKFNDGLEKCVDLQPTIFKDHRKVFEPLRNKNYFKNFKTNLNTITWENEADFAPEYLYSLK